MVVLSPFVYWAQDERSVFLKVDLKDVKNPNVEFGKSKIQCTALGTGAQGLKDYRFFIDLFADIKSKSSIIKITDNSIHIVLVKDKGGWWPRLTSQPVKPAWLKIDFDKWQSEEDILDDEVGNVYDHYPDLYNQLQKEELGYRKEDIKKVYLSLYNIFMYVGYMYIVCVLIISYLRDGPNFFFATYSTVGPAMQFLQLLQYLEVMHPLFGYVKGGILFPFLQVTGRAFILFAMLEFEPRIQKMPVVFYLFLAWAAAEIIRYPYYMSLLYKKENYLLTWLRYSAWIILYPIGFMCEAIIVFRNMIFVHQSQKWSLTLPNAVNFTFDFLLILRIYFLFIMFPAMYTLMKHMYNMRLKKLGGNEPFFKNILTRKVK